MQDSIEQEQTYAPEAYVFLMDALDRSRRDLMRQGHVSSEELILGIQAMARERYGPMAALVFEEWGIKSPADFGSMVFELVDEGVLLHRAEDTIDDFLICPSYRKLFEEEYFLSS